MASTLEDVRADVGAWLQDEWDPDRSLLEWRDRLVGSGWGRPTWPTSWFGRGLPGATESVVAAEFRRVGAVGVAPGPGSGLAGPTLLEHGSDGMKARFLRPLLTGEERWCQLFSEPGSGSDLASLAARADRDGDGWVVNGQKVWNSGADRADYGMLLARTSPNAPKHHGITYFALDMHQPGVEVRPLRQMNGHASFNEVFLTDARVSAADVVGEVDSGWSVALSTLAHERRLNTIAGFSVPTAAVGRAANEARIEADITLAPYRWYAQRTGRTDLLIEMAREFERAADPIVRQRIAEVLTLARCAHWTAERARAARAAGRAPGPEGSLGKLHGSLIARIAAQTHGMIAGAAATLAGDDAVRQGLIAEVLVSVPAISIAGGTDEIQRNIVAERVLGLPREPAQS
jgi:alkylation response protein AidB-like acyl-CoA dehydrogenase